ncbi:hypothetical protein O6H91_02G057300 [Diphasiastrum complanatum]|uniref:Uncharacterized protein n=1 Tax=Diphasiastrum complanatum TaxID=34168 RepID=A0ACC2EFU8_DIPCM|nr:hypothetical protein O6H91_02G057300 [Diphasiastrum complanatum]
MDRCLRLSTLFSIQLLLTQALLCLCAMGRHHNNKLLRAGKLGVLSATTTGEEASVASLISKDLFEQLFTHRNDVVCPAHGFYTYEAFLAAAAMFNGFATTGDVVKRKRELAAFFAQISHETTGGWETAPDGPFAWGLCYKEELNAAAPYCSPSVEWPCASGKKYYGRGPMQLSWNYNYGQAGVALGFDDINNPDLVASDAMISFKTAIWFWMTPQAPKPSCHAVIIDEWKPTTTDIAAKRTPGFGVTTNIINGGLECGRGSDPRVLDRVGYFERYCAILGVHPGKNLDCATQKSF